MRIQAWEDFSLQHRPPIAMAAAVGVFDGLHRGHRELIGRVLARKESLKAVFTFKDNPKKLLRPSSYHGDLSTLEQKLAGLEALGLDLCVLIDFSGDFSKLAGRKFLSVLRESGDIRFLAVGSEFRCGHKLDTSAEDIRAFCDAHGVEADFLDAVHWAGHPISSSRIRKAVVDGRLDDAKAMLGHSYDVDLLCLGRAAAEGGKTAYAVKGDQVQPPDGRYLVKVVGSSGEFEANASLEKGYWLVEAAQDLELRSLRLEKSVSRV